MIHDCLDNLNKVGFHCFDNFINHEEQSKLENIVSNHISNNNNKSFFLMDERLEDTFINSDIFLNKFYKLFYDLSETENLPSYKNQKIFKNLRVIAQSKMHSTSFDFHFDAHQYTILVPIIIPDTGNQNTNGNLILFPNLRKKTKSLIINIIQKNIFQNKISKIIIKYLFNKNLIKKKVIKFNKGDVYLFNGFKSLHGNQPVQEGHVRATLLLHFYDNFYNSKLVKLNRRYRKYIEDSNIKKNSMNS
ncbi:MAG: hypothetical protein CMA12_00605 [Euryarchaeota archaeon]|nr:hypothetical protein [Euryarchaeota archaeon]|tara:strand:+ start:31 stop:771 length:741 start_codon:yes stop_codon:yes gene_type:complete